MAQLDILNTTLSKLRVTVEESDKHTEMVRVRFDRHVIPENMDTKHELFMSAHDLEVIAKFLLEEAEKIRNIQEARPV